MIPCNDVKLEDVTLRHNLVAVKKSDSERIDTGAGTASVEQMASGLYVPYLDATRCTRGRIVKTGPGVVGRATREGTLVLFQDRALLPPAMEFNEPGGEYVVYHETDLLCAIEVVELPGE